MFNWDTYWIFACSAIACWTAGALVALFNHKRTLATIITAVGIGIYALFIGGFWIEMGRPPLSTLGETRLWFSFFLISTGLIIYHLWHYRGILAFCTLMASVFILMNLLKPEIHNRELMPALQSLWFIPHVTIYMVSYAFLGCSFILSLFGLFKRREETLVHCDDMVRMGMLLFIAAMFIGSVWAQVAWGHFWTWDLKETWALITCGMYLIYLQYRKLPKPRTWLAYTLLICAFAALQICWWGVKYLPAASASMHITH